MEKKKKKTIERYDILFCTLFNKYIVIKRQMSGEKRKKAKGECSKCKEYERIIEETKKLLVETKDCVIRELSDLRSRLGAEREMVYRRALRAPVGADEREVKAMGQIANIILKKSNREEEEEGEEEEEEEEEGDLSDGDDEDEDNEEGEQSRALVKVPDSQKKRVKFEKP